MKESMLLNSLLILVMAASGCNKKTRSLHEAVEIGDRDKVEALINKGADVNGKNAEGDTPLHRAAICHHRVMVTYGYEAIVKLLLANGADVNAKNNQGWTPLHRVLDRDIAAILIANGADVSAKDRMGLTPLHIAVGSGHGRIGVPEGYVSADIKARILAEAAAEHKALLYFFIEKGADVNAKDNGGSTPLHEAASAGHKEDVELLIANGAKLNLQDSLGLTPLDEAVMSGHKDIAKILREKATKRSE